MHILGVRIDDVTFSETLAAVDRFVESGGAHQISTVNVEYLMTAQRDAAFAEVLRHTSLNVPDSAGVLWAARWLGRPLRERVTGSDGLYRVAGLCAQRGFRLFLLGAAPGVADRVASVLEGLYPGLQVCGTLAGSPSPEHEAEISSAIFRSRADVLLVAYPHALQEKWIARNLARTGAAVALGVGAAIASGNAVAWADDSGDTGSSAHDASAPGANGPGASAPGAAGTSSSTGQSRRGAPRTSAATAESDSAKSSSKSGKSAAPRGVASGSGGAPTSGTTADKPAGSNARPPLVARPARLQRLDRTRRSAAQSAQEQCRRLASPGVHVLVAQQLQRLLPGIALPGQPKERVYRVGSLA